MKVSFITTVFNEEENISRLLDSLLMQSVIPDEIIIVDGESMDRTESIIMDYEAKIRKHKVRFELLSKNGNRSVCRNEAVKNCQNEIVVCSDAGCILDKNWLENIVKPFENLEVDVVAGNAKGLPKNIFQKCLIPYVLVMDDRVDPNTFLPATRSIAFRKFIWEKVGGFDEEFSNNEDFVFARKLKKIKARIIFQRNAVVYWIPRKNIKDAFVMFYRFAKGDIEARIIRPKVSLLVFRYLAGILLLCLAIIYVDSALLVLITGIVAIYLIWAVIKNYKYVNDLRAIVYLPMLQIISDLAVLSGIFTGLFNIWHIKKTQ